MPIAMGNFFIVGGSCLCHPTSICASLGMSFSVPSSFVGLLPQARAIVMPMTMRMLVTIPAPTYFPCLYIPAQTRAESSERAHILRVYGVS